jgi:thymidylate synthase
MYTEKYGGVNSFLVGASKLLLKEGVKRETRGQVCYELPEPFMFEITNPKARLVTIPERGWNVALAYAESLWLACGRNDLGFIQNYLFRMEEFSDDGKTLRGGYGPRLRKYNGNADDYRIQSSVDRMANYRSNTIDQLDFIIKCFEKDINTRQAIITIGDPVKDSFELNSGLKQTKDFPCTRSLQFMKQPNSKKLNLTVYMRSNDILWGASAVNIFNFTFMQEYIAHLVGLEVGNYYHIANNFHFYEDQKDRVEKVAAVSEFKDESFDYNYNFSTLSEFDKQIRKMEVAESQITENDLLVDFKDDFFNDWYKILYQKRTKREIEFVNPILNKIKAQK